MVTETKLATELTVADSTTFDAVIGANGTALVRLPTSGAPLFWRKPDLHDMSDAPWINVSNSDVALQKNHVFVRQETDTRTDPITVQIQRIVTTDDGLSNPKALRAVTNISVDDTQIEYAVSGEIVSYSNVGTNSHTAVSGTSFKYGLAGLFGGHFQANEMFKHTAATAVTALVGAEINTPAVGSDHPTANDGYGNRYCIDVIARTNESVANWNVDEGDNFGDAEIGTGISVRTDNTTDGYFRFGMAIREHSSNPNSIGTGIRINNSGNYGIHASGANAVAHYYSSGSPVYGAAFVGTYGTAAIRVNSQQAIAMDGTGGIKMSYGVTASVWGFYNGANERAGFDMTATPRLRIGGTAVLGARKTGWAVATGTATRTSFDTSTVTTAQLAERVKALIDDLHSTSGHGIIGT